MKLSQRIMQHLVLAMALFVAFLFMASIFVPDPSQAGDLVGAPAAHSAAARNGLPSLGQLEGDRYEVKVFATPSGPLYSVYDRSGTELASLLTAQQVAERFPQLPLPDARAAEPLKLMDTNTGQGDW